MPRAKAATTQGRKRKPVSKSKGKGATKKSKKDEEDNGKVEDVDEEDDSNEESENEQVIDEKTEVTSKKVAGNSKTNAKSNTTSKKDAEESKNDDKSEVTAKKVDNESKTEVAASSVDTSTKASNDVASSDFNLKIISWNVNGIRAWVEHDGMEYVKSEMPDVFCCQETKCDKTKIPVKAELKGYTSYWLSGDKDGYSGVGLLSKTKPINVTYGINDKKFDTEGRVITAEYEKFFLVNSYIPNASRGLTRLPFRLEWEVTFLKYLKELDAKKPIIWCGDLNVAHTRIDIKNPDSNAKSPGFTKEERDCFTNLLSQGFIDSFRHLNPDKEGAYTYWSYFKSAREKNVGWRLDYFVLSERFKSQLVDSTMKPEQRGSDHCPIILKMLI